MRPPGSKPRRRTPPEGEVEVFIADEQDLHPVDVARWSRLAEHVLADQGVRGEAELSVLFVTEDVIAELNRRFLSGDGPTDVLAFPLDDDMVSARRPDPATTGPERDGEQLEDAPLLLGDVIICPTVAAANAEHHAGSYDDELALLVVHGTLHVLGHDHAEEAERRRMQELERELLERWHGPLAADPWSPDPGTPDPGVAPPGPGG